MEMMMMMLPGHRQTAGGGGVSSDVTALDDHQWTPESAITGSEVTFLIVFYLLISFLLFFAVP